VIELNILESLMEFTINELVKRVGVIKDAITDLEKN
jgi:hypothetical protein